MEKYGRESMQESLRHYTAMREQASATPSTTTPPEFEDDAEAVRWFRQGHADAQFNLGFMYDEGRGVLKDEAEAVCWYRLAAEQGDASAQRILGSMYAGGRGVLKDSVLAHMWLNIAGANGHEVARDDRDNLERDMTRAEISRD